MLRTAEFHDFYLCDLVSLRAQIFKPFLCDQVTKAQKTTKCVTSVNLYSEKINLHIVDRICLLQKPEKNERKFYSTANFQNSNHTGEWKNRKCLSAFRSI